jgi:hypothetical protein
VTPVELFSRYRTNSRRVMVGSCTHARAPNIHDTMRTATENNQKNNKLALSAVAYHVGAVHTREFIEDGAEDCDGKRCECLCAVTDDEQLTTLTESSQIVAQRETSVGHYQHIEYHSNGETKTRRAMRIRVMHGGHGVRTNRESVGRLQASRVSTAQTARDPPIPRCTPPA